MRVHKTFHRERCKGVHNADFPATVDLAAFARPLQLIACIEESYAAFHDGLSLDEVAMTYEVVTGKKKTRAPPPTEGGCYIEGMSVSPARSVLLRLR